MSRIGKLPVKIPSGVKLELKERVINISGVNGNLQYTLPQEVEMSESEGEVTFTPINDSKKARALWGTARSLVANMVEGVSEGFSAVLEINGVGYRAQVSGSTLNMALGFSHPVDFSIPEGIKIECPKNTEIVIKGASKQLVGQTAARIKKYRPPEPYKGKGIYYLKDTNGRVEYVFRKEGKKK